MLRADRPAFLPMDRRQAVAAGVDLPDRAVGAVLFADIAGFTTLSRQLTADLGLRGGVDRLSLVLEDVYDALIATIHDHGGSVLGFSGDAITCWFDDDPRGLVVAAPAPGPLRAASCAQRLIAALADLPPVEVAGAPQHLGIKVAVASGRVARLVVGDPAEGRVDVAGGAPVGRVADLEHVAGLWEVVVDDATLAAIGPDRCTVRERRDTPTGPGHVLGALEPTAESPWRAPAPEVVDPTTATSFVARSLRGRLGDLPTELRPAVSVFVQFTPVDLDAPEGPGLLDGLVRWVQATIAPLDGTLLQVTIGDKASYLYVAFGAPQAHEDLGARAASAALVLREPPPALVAAGPLRIGIAEGMARTGVYGSRASLTFGVLGDGANLAARLMTLAEPGAVLASRPTAQSWGPGFRTLPHPAVRAKGFAEEVPVVVLEGRLAYVAPEISHRRGLVEREEELVALVGLLDAAVEGTGGSVLVLGEAGMGKSHLIAEAKRALGDARDVTWIDARAEELSTAPLAPFITAIADLTYQGLAQDEEDRRQLFDAQVDDLVAAVADRPGAAALAERLEQGRSYLAALVGLVTEGSARELHDERTRLERTLAACVDLFVALSTDRPAVVHVADAEWLDPVSWRLLGLLDAAAVGQRLGVLVDERLEPGRPAAATVALPAARVIEVGALTVAGVAELLGLLLGAAPDEGLVREIHDRTEGAPLFVEQLVGDLLERGGIRPSPDGRLSLDPTVGRQLPVNLSTYLVTRLDQLSASTADIIQRAAILGRVVDLAALRALAGSEEDLDEALAEGVAAGILAWDPVDAARCSFRHALLREVAYETQTADRRRDLHAQAAEALAATGSHPTVLAHHAEQAGLASVAAGHLAVAASEARAMSAPAQAIDHLERALGLTAASEPDAADRVALLSDLGKACSAAGRHQQAASARLAALALAQDPATRIGLLVGLGDALARCGDLAAATEAFDEGIALLQVAPDPEAASRIYAGLSLVAIEEGDLPAAADLAEVSEGLLDAASDPSAAAWAAHRRAMIALRRGRVEEAAVHLAAEAAAAEASGRPEDLAAAALVAGRIAVAQGDLDSAEAELSRAVAAFERCGDEHGLARALDDLGGVLHGLGREAESEGCIERAAELLGRIGLVDGRLFGTLWRSGSW